MKNKWFAIALWSWGALAMFMCMWAGVTGYKGIAMIALAIAMIFWARAGHYSD